MAKNWKKAHDNLLDVANDLRGQLHRQDGEIECANAQLRETGKQLADMGRARDAVTRRLSLAALVIRGAAEAHQNNGRPDLASALYAQADSL